MSSVARGRRLSIDERRDQLLELGIRIFSEHAYDEISTGGIASEGGISKSLLYHYFPSKRDFYVATVQEVARRLEVATRPTFGLAFVETVRQSLSNFLSFVEENGSIFRSLLRSGVGSDREVASIVEGRRQLECQRVLAGLPADQRGPLLSSAVYGWVGLVEATTLDWLEAKDFPRAVLLEFLVAALQSSIAVALKLEPRLESR